MRWTATHTSFTLGHMKTNLTPHPLSMAELGQLDRDDFVARLGGVAEHSPWVVERVCCGAPYASFSALYDALVRCIHDAPRAEQISLLRLHPELAGKEAVAGTMTPESSAEQGRLGLMALSARDISRLTELNHTYQARFGFPFIVALRLHESLESVFAAGDARLTHEPNTEIPIALQQVCAVMRGRLARVVLDPA